MTDVRLVIALLLLAVFAAPRAAGAVRPPAVTAPALPFTDGRATAAWSAGEGRPVQVLTDDRPLGGETALPALAGCRAGAVDRGRVGYICVPEPGHVVLRLEDIASGAVTDAATIADGPTDCAFALEDFGVAFAEYLQMCDHGDGIDYIRLAGHPQEEPSRSSRTVPSLDAPSGYRRLCAPLRIGSHIELTEEGAKFRAFDPAAYHPPWLLTAHSGRALLSRCGSRRVRDLGATTGPVVVTRRFAAWRGPGYVGTSAFATRRTWRYVVDRGRLMDTAPLRATDRRLWFGAGSEAGATVVVEP